MTSFARLGILHYLPLSDGIVAPQLLGISHLKGDTNVSVTVAFDNLSNLHPSGPRYEQFRWGGYITAQFFWGL